ncbi:unnamed protein product [Clonostachys rhizophaga]|uniref:Uncharacterized protein n=1 Tax=Clonostachys rhizophaga TaxID=160324 RepID=A0A9N9VL84_9HYPO|nr:unnamed protein product [Clonostachys rhizophaga]
MEVDSTGRMSAPGFTVSAQPTSQTFVTLVTTTSPSTTQFMISTAFQTVTVSATASPDSQDSSADRAWIAGAVLGPVVLLLIILTGAFFIWRRRRQAAFRASSFTTELSPGEEKSQKLPSPPRHPSELHEDTITPQPQELYGSPPEAPWIVEKPANQVPAQELPANEPAPAFQGNDTSKEMSRMASQSPDEISAR